MVKITTKVLVATAALIVLAFASAGPARADSFLAGTQAYSGATNTFHLSCILPTTCKTVTFPGGQIQVANTSDPTWGIWRSPANNSKLNLPQLWFSIFVPSQNPTLPSSFSIVNGSNSFTLYLVSSTTPWTSSFLFNTKNGQTTNPGYLNLDQVHGPAAPISAFITAAQALAPGTTGFSVYLANLGVTSFVGCSSTAVCGNFHIGGLSTGLPDGSVIYAFAKDTAGSNAGKVTDTTAPSSAIIVPEPGTLVLFGTGLLALAGIVRRRFAA